MTPEHLTLIDDSAECHGVSTRETRRAGMEEDQSARGTGWLEEPARGLGVSGAPCLARSRCALGRVSRHGLDRHRFALQEHRRAVRGPSRRGARGQEPGASFRSRRGPDRARVPADPRTVRAGRVGPAAHGDCSEGQPRLGADRRSGGTDCQAISQAGEEARRRTGSRTAQVAGPRRTRPGVRRLRGPGQPRRRAERGPSSKATARSIGNIASSATSSRNRSATMPDSSTPGSS